MQKQTKPNVTNNSAKGVVWDLSDIYRSPKDPQIGKDLKSVIISAEKFQKNYKSKLNNKLTVGLLIKMFKEYEKIHELSFKPSYYVYLIHSTDNRNDVVNNLMQKAEENYLRVKNLLMFVELELAKIKDSAMNKLLKDEKLKDYKHYIKKSRVFRKYFLTEPEEKILSLKSQTSGSAFDKLFENINTDMVYELKDKKGKSKKMNQSQILSLLHDFDRKIRQRAATSFTNGLEEKKKTLTFIFNKLLLDEKINDELRGLPTPQEGRHLRNEVTEKMVGNLVGVCEKNYNIVSQYYSLKKKLLKLDKLYDWDRHAPVARDMSRVSYIKSKQIILESFRKFSPKLSNIANSFFTKKKIHAQISSAKQGGAYCWGMSPKIGPYMFANYMERNKDLLTLAHEIGHGIHAQFSKRQNYFNYDHPMVTAEIASVFCEMLTFENLKTKKKDKKKRLFLLCQFLEDTFTTTFRQINMYKFELEAHNLFRQKGELTTDEINKLWRNNQQKMFGKSLTITEDHGYWWLYVGHVFGVYGGPFYIYAYTFACLLVFSIYAEYKKKGKKFIDKYIELLSSGGREKPEVLLKIVGQDITKPNFWQKGMDLIQELLDEAKQLAKEVNYKI